MPRQVSDVTAHNKSVSDKDKPAWVQIANDTRDRCLKDGGTEAMCDAMGIATANAAAKNFKENAMDEELLEAMKTEDGQEYPAAAFAYVPDPTKPSEWKLRLWASRSEKETAEQVGAAAAAFSPGGFRGQKVSIPAADMAAVKARVRAAWKRVNPDKKPEEMPSGIKEADEIFGDFEALEEKAVGEDGSILVKCIGPGWGSSGYYSPDVLTRDVAAYKTGTKAFWDHPTAQEAKDRPERSLRDLAGEFIEDGQYMADGPKGPGIYAKAKVFAPYKAAVEELAPHIGMSHRAIGTKVYGEAEGRKGPIIEKITAVHSVDFVTAPGAKGEIVQMFEAARTPVENTHLEWQTITLEALKSNRGDLIEALRDEMRQAIYDEKNALKEEHRMTEERIAELEEASKKLTEELEAKESELARLREAEILRQAKDIVTEKVEASELPDITKARLTETISKNPTLTEEGTLDIENYSQHINEAIKAEMDYVAKLTESGKIKGMGAGETESKGLLKESFKRGYLREGKSEDEADRLADIAARGR